MSGWMHVLTPRSEQYIHWVQEKKLRLINSSLASSEKKENEEQKTEESLFEQRWEVGAIDVAMGMVSISLTTQPTETSSVPFLERNFHRFGLRAGSYQTQGPYPLYKW